MSYIRGDPYNLINLRWRADCDLNYQIDEFTTHFPFIHIITIRKHQTLLGAKKKTQKMSIPWSISVTNEKFTSSCFDETILIFKKHDTVLDTV